MIHRFSNKSPLEIKVDELQIQLLDLKKQIQDSLANKSTAFEVGRWYKSSDGVALLICGTDEDNCTGFWRGKWGHDWTFESELGKKDLIPATSDEVKEALVKEAIKRYPVGTKFKSATNKVDVAEILESDFYYSLATDAVQCLQTAGMASNIYHKGQWAEIVKEKPVTIAGFTCEIDGNSVRIGCKRYTKSDVGSLVGCMKIMGITSISVDTHTASLSEWQTLLDNWK